MGHSDYDAWKTGWYEASKESDPDAENNDDESVTLSAQDWNDLKVSFLAITKQLYSKDQLNTSKLEDHLGWMAYELGLTLPVEEIKIERKKEKPSNLFMFVADLSRKSVNL